MEQKEILVTITATNSPGEIRYRNKEKTIF